MRRSVTAAALIGLAALAAFGWCALGATEGASYKPRPIPAGEEAYTHKKLMVVYALLVKSELEDSYQQIGRRSPAWDDQAVAYLQAYGKSWVEAPDAPSDEELRAQGEAVVRAGCDDPMVLFLYGVALQDVGRRGEAEPFLRRGIEGFKTVPYSRGAAAYAPLRLAAACEAMGGEKAREAPALRKLCVEWLADWLSHVGQGKDEVRTSLLRVRDVLDQLPLADCELLYAKLKEGEGIHPYVRDFVGGSVFIDKAWEARGGDWASEVSEAGWRGFEANLKKARSLLTRAWRNYPEYPQAPAEMIRVTMGGGGGPGETERLWFDRAVAAQLDYYDAYEALTRALLPRWGGSHEEMYDLGVECLNTGRFDTNVPMQFMQVLLWITHDYDGDASVWTAAESQGHLGKLFDGYEGATTGERHTYWRSARAATAWFLGDYDQARAIADELGDSFDTSPLKESFDADPTVALGQVYAFTGVRGREAREAESRYERGDLQGAAAAFAEIAKADDLDERGRRFLRDRAVVSRLEADFAKGEWVALKPDPSLAGWTSERGKWSVESDGSLTASDPAWVWIHCNADFGDRLEVRGELEFVTAKGDDPEGSIELRCHPEGPADAVRVLLHRALGRIEIDASTGDPIGKKAEIRDVNSFHVQLRKDVVSVSVNGKQVIAGARAREDVPGGRKRIGFGSGSPEISLRLRKLEVRRLPRTGGQSTQSSTGAAK
ncbi:MAG: hypothetical protein ACE149_04630 [Armatimonadota bacterium]